MAIRFGGTFQKYWSDVMDKKLQDELIGALIGLARATEIRLMK